MKCMALVGLSVLAVSCAAAAPIDVLKDLGPALSACWRAPDDSAGSQVTVVFSLDRSGAVIGKPRISYAKLVGDAAANQGFVAAVLGALACCTPVAVTPGLGGAIAGRPLSIRFIGGPSGTGL